MERLLVLFLYFQGLVWLCRAAVIPVNVGQEQIEEHLSKLFYNVETGQNLTHGDNGIIVPLDNILDPVVAHPTGNRSQNAEPDCAAGGSLLELDLCLSPAQVAMFDSQGLQHGGRRKRESSANGFSLWNNGVIPFIFNSTFSAADTDAILSAMSEWQKATCIRFRQAAGTDRDVVVFKDGIRCSTNIGRIGNEQLVTLSDKCRTKRILIHELGHVIGLIHEHQRHDRDKYVKVIFENVRNVSQERYQFSKLLSESLTERMVNYDYTSIMHYGRNYFAKSPELTTLQTTDSHYQDIIGRAEKPSLSDIETVNRLYHCVASCPPSLRCGDSCFMDSQCVCRCPASVDQTFHNDPGLYRNNLLDSACEFFARRGDCGGSMKDTIGHLCIQSCRLYQRQLNTHVLSVTSAQSPFSIKVAQSTLVTPHWGFSPNLQPSGKLNNSSNHKTVFKNTQNRSSASSLLPVKTHTSTRSHRQKGRVGSSLRGKQHTSRSPVQGVTFPEVIKQRTSNLFLPRNVGKQQLQTQNTSRDISLHQRRITNNSTKTRPRNRTRALVVAIKRQQTWRPVNRNSRRFLARNATRMPPVRLRSLHHLNQNNSSLRVPAYRIYRQSGLSNRQQEHHRAIPQPALRQRQPTKDPYDINSFIEFVISRQLSIPRKNAGTNRNGGRADIHISNFAINCQSNICGRNPWKGTNEYMPNKNISTTGETDKLNQRHLVLTDSTGPEFGLTVNHRPSNSNDNVKMDSVINDHGMQVSLPHLIKYDIASGSLTSRNYSFPSRYPVESSTSVPWDPPSRDLAESSPGQTVGNIDTLHVVQSIDAFVTNTELVPQSPSP